jgi:hypothetical protein
MTQTIAEVHKTIKAQLAKRTTEQLINDAKVAAKNRKNDEAQRMVFALTMDVLFQRISESEWEALYSELEEQYPLY